MMKRMNWIAILLTLLLAVTSVASPAIERPPDGQGVFLVVLGGQGTEPDFAAMGGRVLESWSDRRLVMIPRDRLAALQEHSRVQYVQRVWTGEEAAASFTEQSLSTAVRTDGGPTPPAWSSAYTYDPSGNVESITKHDETHEYAYDAVNRLKQATFHRGTPVAEQIQQYSYDPYGNLVGIGDQPLSVDPSTNRLDDALVTYDTAGRLTGDADGRQYRYDGAGMNTLLDIPAGVAVDGDRRMIYTADDERIATISATRVTYRVRDFNAHVLREWTSENGKLPEWERDYIYAGSSLVAGEVQIDKRKNGMRHYHADHLGSTRMVTNGAAELVSLHDYQPFGAEFTPTTTEFDNTAKAPRDFAKFTGHERDYLTVANQDGDALDYMHARFYAPKWGRFLTVDPGKDWNPKQPQRWNLYAYVQNNPLNAVDPDGKALLETLDMIRTRLSKAMGHFDRANEAFSKVVVKNVTAGGKLCGVAGNFGPIKAEARVDVRVGKITNGAVPVTIRGAIQGGAAGTKYQSAVRVGVSGDVKLDSIENVKVTPDQTFGTEAFGGRSSPYYLAVTGGAYGVTGELGVNFEEAARGLGELGAAWTAVTTSGTPIKDRDQ